MDYAFLMVCLLLTVCSFGAGALLMHGINKKSHPKELETLAPEKQVEFILGVTKTGLDIIDSDYNIRYIDNEWRKVYGDPTGRKCYEYFMDRSNVCPGCGIAEAIRTKKIKTTEETLVKENNRVIQVTTIPFQDTNGDWLVAEINVDITQRRQMEDALRVSEQKYRQIIEMAHEGIVSFNSGGIITFVNSEFCSMLQRSHHDIIGKPLTLFLPQNRIQNILQSCSKSARSLTEIEILRQDDSVIHALISVSPIKASEDDLISYQAFITDVTDQKRLEYEIQRADKLESVGVLAGGIAHDFNNILTSIIGNISLARMFISNQEMERSIERLDLAEKAVMRSKTLTMQLLTFSKGGTPILQVESMQNILKDSAEFVLRGSNIICKINTPDDLWCVEMDSGQISQVLHNLIINAVQSMPSGGRIDLEGSNVEFTDLHPPALKPGKYVKISVRDHGVGIPKDVMSKIFDLYFTTKTGGSGLGLSTSYSIISKHQGWIHAESKISKGSTFTFYLPAANEKKQRKEMEIPVISQGKGTILVMDDDELIREFAVVALKNLGYDPMTASTGDEVLKVYRELSHQGVRIDAMILDLTVPGGMGGCETVRELKKMDPGIKVVVSSGYSNDPIMSDFRASGFDAVISKPFHIETLAQILNQLTTG